MEIANKHKGFQKRPLPTLYEIDREQNFSPSEIPRYSNFSLNNEIDKTWDFFQSYQFKYQDSLPKKPVKHNLRPITTTKRPTSIIAKDIFISKETGTAVKLSIDELINAFEDPNTEILQGSHNTEILQGSLTRSDTTYGSSGSSTIPSLPRSISNDSGNADNFVKIINNADDSDNEEDFKRVINSIQIGSNRKKIADCRKSATSSISAISESETLYCNNENLIYKKFGRFISIEINGVKKIYDIFDIHRNVAPLPISMTEMGILERKNDEKIKKNNQGLLKRIFKRIFK